MHYTFLIGHGYVEGAMNTVAIVNYYSEEENPTIAVVNFINALREVASKEIIKHFLHDYFHRTADGLGNIGVFEDVDRVDWWGTVEDGPIIRLWAFNHFFNDREEDGYDWQSCDFDIVDEETTALDVKRIYEDTYGTEVKEEIETVPPRTFGDEVEVNYQIQHIGAAYIVQISNLNGSTFRLSQDFSTDKWTKDRIDEWMRTHIAKKAVRTDC